MSGSSRAAAGDVAFQARDTCCTTQFHQNSEVFGGSPVSLRRILRRTIEKDLFMESSVYIERESSRLHNASHLACVLPRLNIGWDVTGARYKSYTWL